MNERSRCPKCESRMVQVHVEPSFAGPDLRTLECPECELAYHALADDQGNRELSGLAKNQEKLLQLAADRDPSRDEARHKILMTLLDDEMREHRRWMSGLDTTLIPH
jgi:hypothetical protein